MPGPNQAFTKPQIPETMQEDLFQVVNLLTHGFDLQPVGLQFVEVLDQLALNDLYPDTWEANYYWQQCRLIASDGRPALSPSRFFHEFPTITCKLLKQVLNLEI